MIWKGRKTLLNDLMAANYGPTSSSPLLHVARSPLPTIFPPGTTGCSHPMPRFFCPIRDISKSKWLFFSGGYAGVQECVYYVVCLHQESHIGDEAIQPSHMLWRDNFTFTKCVKGGKMSCSHSFRKRKKKRYLSPCPVYAWVSVVISYR